MATFLCQPKHNILNFKAQVGCVGKTRAVLLQEITTMT